MRKAKHIWKLPEKSWTFFTKKGYSSQITTVPIVSKYAEEQKLDILLSSVSCQTVIKNFSYLCIILNYIKYKKYIKDYMQSISEIIII